MIHSSISDPVLLTVVLVWLAISLIVWWTDDTEYVRTSPLVLVKCLKDVFPSLTLYADWLHRDADSTQEFNV